MRAVLAATMICFASTLVYCAGAEEGATKPTPPEVIDAIKKLGGSVKVDKDKAVVSVFFPTLQTVTDTELVHLKELTKLQRLNLAATNVTDAGLVRLKGLTDLKMLVLEITRVTDAGLVHLKGLTKLEELHLHGTKITGAGLVHLKGMTKLEYLNLNGTKITDAGLVHLEGLTKVGALSFIDTKVTWTTISTVTITIARFVD